MTAQIILLVGGYVTLFWDIWQGNPHNLFTTICFVGALVIMGVREDNK